MSESGCQSHLVVEFVSTLKHFRISLTFTNFGTVSVGGIMVSIAAFQAVDPGSIPGRRNIFSFFFQAHKPANYAVLHLNIAFKESQNKSFPLPGIEPGPPG